MGQTSILRAACLLLPWSLIALREMHLRMQMAERQDRESEPHHNLHLAPHLVQSAAHPTHADARPGQFLQSPVARAPGRESKMLSTKGPNSASPVDLAHPTDRPWHAQKPRPPNDRTQACQKGTKGIFLLGLKDTQKKHKCTIKDVDGNDLCKNNRIIVKVREDSCTRFQITRVKSCGEKDLKCPHYNCKGLGVLRLETATGVLVEPGTQDKMLTCGNMRFSLDWEAFCRDGDESCEGSAAWTWKTTTQVPTTTVTPTTTSTPTTTPAPTTTLAPTTTQAPAPAPHVSPAGIASKPADPELEQTISGEEKDFTQQPRRSGPVGADTQEAMDAMEEFGMAAGRMPEAGAEEPALGELEDPQGFEAAAEQEQDRKPDVPDTEPPASEVAAADRVAETVLS